MPCRAGRAAPITSPAWVVIDDGPHRPVQGSHEVLRGVGAGFSNAASPQHEGARASSAVEPGCPQVGQISRNGNCTLLSSAGVMVSPLSGLRSLR